MAERRMFAKTIIDSDAFIDMPVTARLLYYDLGMRADDDGFVNSPKKIMRMVGASQDDLAILISKKFIIPFDSGVVVIKHWRIHNYIRQDRKHDTKYEKEMSQITIKENGAYTLVDTCLPSDCQMVDNWSTEVRLGKDRLDKGKEKKKFTKPTLDELKAYIKEHNLNVDAEYFIDYYESNGWKIGKASMKSWQSTVRNWDRREKKTPSNKKHVVIEKPSYIVDEAEQRKEMESFSWE